MNFNTIMDNAYLTEVWQISEFFWALTEELALIQFNWFAKPFPPF
jgi:hypothetical protein